MEKRVGNHPEVLDLRRKIDRIDDALIELLERRASYAAAIGRIKRRIGAPVLDAGREQVLLERLRARSGGSLDALALERIFETILTEMRRLQRQQSSSSKDATASQGVAPPGMPQGEG